MRMRNLLLASLLAGSSTVALAAVLGEPEHTAGAHGLTGWVPRKIEDEKRARREVEALMEEMHAAYREGNIAAAASLMDFPVYMVTDDWKGEAVTAEWDRDRWMERMGPLFRSPVPDLRQKHEHNVFIVSDSLANVDDEQRVRMGRTTVTIRSSSLVIRKGRRWLVKSVIEGGWGDSQLVKPPGEGAGAAPAQRQELGR